MSRTIHILLAAFALALMMTEPGRAQDPRSRRISQERQHPNHVVQWAAPQRVARRNVPPSRQETLPEPKRGATALVPWWQEHVVQSLGTAPKRRRVSLDTLIIDALLYSPRIQSISDRPLIHREAIVEANAQFDSRAFMESKFVRTSEPVGNALTTGPGGSNRFREEDWFYNAGVRRRTRTGGTTEFSQQIGILNNNSQFLAPPQQGNARLVLSYKQPLLNGAGRAYNESLVVLANIETDVARDRMFEQLQDHLLEVTKSYWELHLQRTSLIQKRRRYQRAKAILDELDARRDVDALGSEILRARAAVTARQSELIRAETMIRNAEARIRALVSGPEMLDSRSTELVPLDRPMSVAIDVNLKNAIVTALGNRPEIDEAMQQIRAASVRLDVSKNELMPALDVVLETYVTGLDGNYGIGQALADQFSVGEPSYSAGLIFEVPLGNRAACARHRRRRVELRQLTSRFQATMETLSAEVEVAVREVQTTYLEMQARYSAMAAAEKVVQSLHERLRLDLGDEGTTRFVSSDLSNLLDAQDRLGLEELGFAESQRAYTVSLTALKRAMGTLLQHEQITHHVICDDCLPRTIFDKSPAPRN